MGEPIIRIRNLYRRFPSGDGEVTILKGLNLDIEAGEMVAIIGQSGSGKSTLMNILGCLDRPSDGEYYINGKNATDLSPQRAPRRYSPASASASAPSTNPANSPAASNSASPSPAR